MTDNLTWEDVFAVCKLMGVAFWASGFDDGSYCILKPFNGFATSFLDPAAALEFISAEEHSLEKKHGRILRTKP